MPLTLSTWRRSSASAASLSRLSARAAGRFLVVRDRMTGDRDTACRKSAHLADHRLLQAARQPHLAELLLDALVVAREVLVELGLAPRHRRLLAVPLRCSRCLVRRSMSFFGRDAQLLELLLVGLGAALLRRDLSGSSVSSKMSRRSASPASIALADLDHEIQRDRRAENLLLDLVFAGFDALGDFDFLLAREQLEVAHLLQVEADRVGGFAERIGGGGRASGCLFGLFLGLGLGLARRLRPGLLRGP